MENKFYVYLYHRSKNSKHGEIGSPYYVGKGSGRRAWAKRHRVKPPEDRALIEIISKDMNEADALQAEMLLIMLYGRADRRTGCLRNYTDGGEFTPAFRGITSPMKGKSHSEEAKNRMAKAKLGRINGPQSEEWRANISKGQIGKIVTMETRTKLSLAHKGKPKQPRTPEHCEAIRQAKLGRSRPDMKSGSDQQIKSALTRLGIKRGPYNMSNKETNNGD